MKSVFVCTQEPTLFSTSIAENIRYGAIDAEGVSDDQLWDAAKMANAEVFIRQFPGGLDTLVGERGIMLSGLCAIWQRVFSCTTSRLCTAKNSEHLTTTTYVCDCKSLFPFRTSYSYSFSIRTKKYCLDQED